ILPLHRSYPHEKSDPCNIELVRQHRQINVVAQENLHHDYMTLNALTIPDLVELKRYVNGAPNTVEREVKTSDYAWLTNHQNIFLSLEDGSDNLFALKINFTKYITSQKILDDYILFLQEYPEVELWIVYPNGVQDKLIPWLLKLNHKKIKYKLFLLDNSLETYWAHDASKPIYNGTLLPTKTENSSPTEYEQYLSTLTLGKMDGFRVITSPFEFAGGNLIVARDAVFIGTNDIQSNAKMHKRTPNEILTAMEQLFAKPVIEVGLPIASKNEYKQPDFHIDLSMAVAIAKDGVFLEQNVVLLNSPKLLFELLLNIDDLTTISNEEFDTLIAEKIVPALRFYDEAIPNSKDKEELKINQLLLNSYQGLLMSYKRSDVLKAELAYQAIQRLVQDAGFKVIKLPGVSRFNHAHYLAVAINYTNVIFHRDRVLLPVFNIPALDEYTQKVYKSIGYKYFPMHTPRLSLCRGGGVRCLTETYR
ncbi:MAG: hypothetical protein KDD40_02500, partial [Bdellovibrionales bacterium]|nr:hypothetical protein [Bdellovibrionales bacterium]